MARKRCIDTIVKEFETLSKREESLQAELDKVVEKKKQLSAERSDLIEAERRVATDKIGETVYQYFGENISPDKFKETLELLMSVDEAKDFIRSESKTKEVVPIDKTEPQV